MTWCYLVLEVLMKYSFSKKPADDRFDGRYGLYTRQSSGDDYNASIIGNVLSGVVTVLAIMAMLYITSNVW